MRKLLSFTFDYEQSSKRKITLKSYYHYIKQKNDLQGFSPPIHRIFFSFTLFIIGIFLFVISSPNGADRIK